MTLPVIHRSSRLVRHVGRFAFHSHHRNRFLSTHSTILSISQVELDESANLGRYRGFRGITRHLGTLGFMGRESYLGIVCMYSV